MGGCDFGRIPPLLFLYLVVLLTCSVKRRVVNSRPAGKRGLAFGYPDLASRFLGPCVAPVDPPKPVDPPRRLVPQAYPVASCRGSNPWTHPVCPPRGSTHPPADKVRLNERLVSVYGRNRSSNDALCPGTCTQGTIFSLCRCLRVLRPGVLASSMTKAPPKCMAVSSPAHSSFIDSAGSIVTSRTKQP